MSKELERLQKRIASSGYTSRRKAETLITDGKVKVNGQVVTELGTKVSNSDTVEVEGIKLEQEDKRSKKGEWIEIVKNVLLL